MTSLMAQPMNESQIFAIGSAVYDINPPSGISVTLYRMPSANFALIYRWQVDQDAAGELSVEQRTTMTARCTTRTSYLYLPQDKLQAYTVPIDVRLGLSSQHAIWHPLRCQPNQICLALASPTRSASLSRKDGYDRAIVRAMCIGKNTLEDCATCLCIVELHIRCHYNDTRETSIWYSATSGYQIE
uniref:Uncharacterized protein n=1 Tax=Leersia perrieri TaxID=77586 RepID=A0A0D9W3N0_9ORYZ